MANINTAAFHSVLTKLDKVGGTVPKATAEGFDRLTTLADKVRHLSLSSDVAGAIIDALDADRDPATDPAVVQQIARREIAAAEHSLRAALDDRMAAFLATHTEAILDAFRAALDQAATTITDALDQLGDVDLAETRAVLSKGGDAAKVWGEAQTAVTVITEAQTAWKLLAAAGAPCSVRKGTTLLLIAELEPSTWIENELHRFGDNLTAWDAARRGYPLSWATPATYGQRYKGIRNESARRGDAAAEAKRKASGRPWRHGPAAVA